MTIELDQLKWFKERWDVHHREAPVDDVIYCH